MSPRAKRRPGTICIEVTLPQDLYQKLKWIGRFFEAQEIEEDELYSRYWTVPWTALYLLNNAVEEIGLNGDDDIADFVRGGIALDLDEAQKRQKIRELYGPGNSEES